MRFYRQITKIQHPAPTKQGLGVQFREGKARDERFITQKGRSRGQGRVVLVWFGFLRTEFYRSAALNFPISFFKFLAYFPSHLEHRIFDDTAQLSQSSMTPREREG